MSTSAPITTVPDVARSRARECAALRSLLQPGGPQGAYVHGIAGVGKTALLRSFLAEARDAGAKVVALDGRAIEPTEDGFLRALAEHFGAELTSAGAAAQTLSRRGGRWIIAIDDFHALRLIDSWLRQAFMPAIAPSAAVVLVGRLPPGPAWMLGSDSGAGLLGLLVEPLSDDAAFVTLRAMGVPEPAARRITQFARGHPLALRLAASAVLERPRLDFPDTTLQRVIADLSQLLCTDITDPALRRAFEAMSLFRRINRPVLEALFPESDGEALFEALADLPTVERQADGLSLHDAVRPALAAGLEMADPDRARGYRRTVWRHLRRNVRRAVASQLWSCTADVIYLLENPVVREAFFPSQAQTSTVEPAGSADREAIAAISERWDGPEATKSLMAWWQRTPQAFRVVRDSVGATTGFYCMLQSDWLSPVAALGDPLVSVWQEHVRSDSVPPGAGRLYIRRWLSRQSGEAPSAEQAACWLDIKRTYMALRPKLRRVYLALKDLAPYAPVATELGFRPLPGDPVVMDGEPYVSACLDFGPASVDGWISGLVAAELGLEQDGLLDTAQRQLVLNGQRIPLTGKEFGLFQYLWAREGDIVDRDTLLNEVWGLRYSGGSNVVDAVVRTLRRKLGQQAACIETVRGVGYRLRL